ncbi:hypothetical protein SpCBS45565_g04522 [Spizellomyces sp. 'palustris']|nr:hypothetical protein SpCBS45565_g04522 [Spizellomyces sp. 'palustris']
MSTKQHVPPRLVFAYLVLVPLILLVLVSPRVNAQGPASGAPTNNTNNNSTSKPSIPSGPLATLEPPPGKRLFGAWLNTTGDTPALFNSHLGRNASVFLFTLYIPPEEFATKSPASHLELIDQTASDAIVHLSVFPRKGLDSQNVRPEDLQTVVNICKGLNKRGRGVLLRFAPGMNVPWVPWGQQPILFINTWRDLGRKLRSTAEANQTALVWAPWDGNGYPWAGDDYSVKPGTADYDALDTSKDGNVTALDNPYSPYYPGDEWVDWVGLSIYHKGPRFPWVVNSIPTSTSIEDALQGKLLPSFVDFYNAYGREKNKPVMLAETGAVYHFNATTGASTSSDGTTELATKQAWWQQYMNKLFLDTFPKVKMVCLYEAVEVGKEQEAGTLLDYRVLNSTREAFLTDLTKALDSFQWANYTGFRTTYVPNDAKDDGGTGNSKGDGGGNGDLTRLAIAGMVLLPIMMVGLWVGCAVCRFRKRKAARQRAEAEAANPLPDTASEKGSDVDGDVESVDDGATIVNVRIGNPSDLREMTGVRDSEDEVWIDGGDDSSVDEMSIVVDGSGRVLEERLS